MVSCRGSPTIRCWSSRRWHGCAPSAFGDTSWPTVSGVRGRPLHYRWSGCAPHRSSRRRSLGVRAVDNVAITAFDVRSTLDAGRRGPDSQVGTAYLEIANFAAKPQTVHITMSAARRQIAESNTRSGAQAKRTGRLCRSLVRGSRSSTRMSTRPTTRSMWTTMGMRGLLGHVRLSVVVVGDHTEWIRRLLVATLTSARRLSRRRPIGSAAEDVTIFDRWAPAEMSAHAGTLFRAA